MSGSLLYPEDDLPEWLRQDPQAAALLATLRQGGGGRPVAPVWRPDNPVGTETIQSLGVPASTSYGGLLSEFVDPSTGRLTDRGKARMDDNPMLGFDTGGLSTGGLLGMIKAYHGSPHQFDAFDMSKIGTGEGAQAYGHGMYLAENEGVARGYQENLSNPQLFVDGKKVGEVGALGTDPTANAAHALLLNGKSAEAAKGYVQRAMERAAQGNFGFSQGTGKAVLKAIDQIDPSKVEMRPGGNMYEVNVNADPERFLHWDKPLSEQHPDVQAALENVLSPDNYKEFMSGRGKNMTAGGMHDFAFRMNPKRFAIDAREAGIPGIRYLDQGSRGAGEGSHNYVVFDPATMNIIRRYGLAGLLGGGAASAGLLGDGS